MNSLTNIAGYRPESDNSPVSRAGLPPGPALPVGPLDPQELKQILESQRYEELLVEYDVHEKIVWYFMNPTSRPSATVGLMKDIKRLQTLVRTVIEAHNDPKDPPIKYMALSSRLQGIFNLGGDLALFAQLIRERDRDALDRYARLSIDVIHANSANLDLPIITASVVQGDALGGGFEAALSSNLIIAERSAKFGLPEVLFNLFPGMGAYTFLARRIDPSAAEKMLLSGKIYTAEELFEAGVVDAVVEDGDGEQALYDHIIKHGRQFISHRSIYKVRGIVNPITYDEMARITDVWVDAAMSIGEDDLSRMERLASAQDRRWAKRG
ncbi:MAG: crotonase/enoyl-CoA hydratase family protein [Alphaproteobacteria bacterium]